MSINLSDDQKFQILKEAFVEQKKEIFFWRDRSWKVTTWLIGLMLIIVSSTFFTKTTYPLILIPFISLSVITVFYLNKNYKVYCMKWEKLTTIEDALGFFEDNFYLNGKPLNPVEYKTPKVTYKGTGFFITSIWIMVISTSLIILLK